MSAYHYVCIEIRNNTSGRSLLCEAFVFPLVYACGDREFQSLLHTKLGVGDPPFDNGDDVSISVRPHDPAIQIKAIGVQWLHEEEGKDEVINAKVEIASRIFTNYYCGFHGKSNDSKIGW